MKRYLGDILVGEGFIKPDKLQIALDYQIRKLIGEDLETFSDLNSLLYIARARYNIRREYLLGKILKQLNLTSESNIEKALKIQDKIDKPLRGTRLTILKSIVQRINSTYNLIDILNQILIFATNIVDAESSSIVMYDHAKDKLVIIMPTGIKADYVRELEIPPDRGIVGWVFRNNEPLIVNDVERDQRFYDKVDKISGYKTHEILCVPLSVKNKLIGVIEVINKNKKGKKGKKGFTKNDMVLLEIFSAESGIAIEKTRLYYNLKQLQYNYPVSITNIQQEKPTLNTLEIIARSYIKDLKSSLIPVNGYAELIEKNTDDYKIKKYGTFIKNELYEIMAKTDDILKYSGGSFQLAKKNVKLTEIVEEFKNYVWTESRLAQISIEVNIDNNTSLIADPKLLARALVYLFKNSLDAMPSGGIFGINAYQTEHPDALNIIVWDTGHGIETSVREKVFQPFFSYKKKHGAGLGLAISKKIVECHGGKIELLSDYDSKNYDYKNYNGPKSGAVFRITLPI